VFSNKEHICYRQLRNLPPDQFTKLRIQYEHPLLSVLYFNQNTYQYELCFTMELDLQFKGYFLISGGSGIQIPDHAYVKSFKLYDAKVYANNEHYQEARRAKAQHEGIQENMHAKDLLYHRSDKEASQNHNNLEELFNKIPEEHL